MTIAIIAILAGIVLVAAQAAQQAANRANTQALISKLHGQLMVRLESYRTRRIPIAPNQWNPYLTASGNPMPAAAVDAQTDEALASMSPRHGAAHRLATIRELMRMELPDRYTDILSPPVIYRYGPDPVPSFLPQPPQAWMIQPTATNLSYRTRLANNPSYTMEFEDAECLYLILNTGLSDDTVAGELINPENVGDADGDGMLEFQDAWGRPIHFIRWAPGFVSDLQPDDPANSPQDRRFVMKNHDQFDPLKMQAQLTRNLSGTPLHYEEGFALYPLVYSAGQDGVTDTCRSPSDANGNPPTSPLFIYSTQTGFTVSDQSIMNPKITFYPHVFPYNPYQLVMSRSVQTQFGTPEDDNGDGDSNGNADNITNHLLGQQ